jgi:hypothetical protein
MSNTDAQLYEKLCRKIRIKTVIQVDEEDFSEWNTCAIYFNKDAKIVLMHPR